MSGKECPNRKCGAKTYEWWESKTAYFCRTCGHTDRTVTASALCFCDRCQITFLEVSPEANQHDGHPVYTIDVRTNRRRIGTPPA